MTSTTDKPHVWKYEPMMTAEERPWIVSQVGHDPTDHETWDAAISDALERACAEEGRTMTTYDENESSCIVCRAYITSNTPAVVGSWLDAFGQNYRRVPEPHLHTPARLA